MESNIFAGGDCINSKSINTIIDAQQHAKIIC
jgi:hypothetical protein